MKEKHGFPNITNKNAFPFLNASQNHDALIKATTYLFAIYFVLGVSVIAFDLGNNDFGKMLAELGQSIIPSIRPTSQMVSKPESSALVLFISWIWGIALTIPLLLFLAKDGESALKREFLKRELNPLKIIFLWMIIFVVILLFATKSADEIVEADGYIRYCLETTPYFMVLWGIQIISAVTVLLYMASISLVLFQAKNIKEK